MKLVAYDSNGERRVGVVDGDVVLDAGTDLFHPEPAGEAGAVGALRLLAPVERPEKIVCIGLNYRDHAAETGAPLPDKPMLFAKWSNALAGPGDAIRLPAISSMVDYEAELGVVIGRTASRVTTEDALSYVLGYTCLNDVSARDLQGAEPRWIRGKALDTFCPTGPWVVTADEIPDPQALGIRCRVNGETLQDSTTGEMVFGVAELIAFISEAITLQPGDLIATGTPPGVGVARNPQRFLRHGDTVEVEIDGIGTLSNPVIG
jgi:2-keto-4-pentenoate hydratase/2-oxohepta-3-ene-1,7-dioic acid hydratase in catechol pathway